MPSLPKPTTVQLLEDLRLAMTPHECGGVDGSKPVGRLQAVVHAYIVIALSEKGWIEKALYIRDLAEREQQMEAIEEHAQNALYLLQQRSYRDALEWKWKSALVKLLSAESIHDKLRRTAYWITESGEAALKEAQ